MIPAQPLQPPAPTGLAAATPWWGTLLVAAVGVAGIFITQWMTNRREHDKIRRERDEKRRTERIDAYGSFMQASVMVRKQLSVTSSAFREAFAALTLGSARIQLLGPEAVANGSTRMMGALGRLEGAQLEGDEAAQKVAQNAYDEAGLALMSAMQAAIADPPDPAPRVFRSTL